MTDTENSTPQDPPPATDGSMSEPAPPEPGGAPPLTAIDVRALREASRVGFYHNAEKRPERPGLIVATKELARPTPWESERDHRIDVESEIVTFGDPRDREDADSGLAPYRYAYESVTLYRHSRSSGSDAWQTIAALLRPGDLLALRWHAGGRTCDLYRNKDLYGDDLYLVVRRGKRTMTFLIDVSVSPANTPAAQADLAQFAKAGSAQQA